MSQVDLEIVKSEERRVEFNEKDLEHVRKVEVYKPQKGDDHDWPEQPEEPEFEPTDDLRIEVTFASENQTSRHGQGKEEKQKSQVFEKAREPLNVLDHSTRSRLWFIWNL